MFFFNNKKKIYICINLPNHRIKHQVRQTLTRIYEGVYVKPLSQSDSQSLKEPFVAFNFVLFLFLFLKRYMGYFRIHVVNDRKLIHTWPNQSYNSLDCREQDIGTINGNS